MTYNFDQLIERRHTDSAKWNYFAEDVLPMWVADMDFRSPEPVVQALRRRVEHGVFGYGWPTEEEREVICERMARLYDWEVTPDQVLFLPGVVSSLNAACRAVGKPGDGILVQTPVYYPFLSAPGNYEMTVDIAELPLTCQGDTLYYEIDYDVFEAAITPRTRMFLLCSPHNPTGRSYTREELTRLAEICVRHNLIICSDEIHCDLMMDGNAHLPTAAIDPEISERCITLMAPSKTFNIPGLGLNFAIVQNPNLMTHFKQATAGIVPHVRLMGVVAAMAAYTKGGEWLDALLKYLTSNRDFLVDYVAEHLPGIRTTIPEATYLAWLDCREGGIEGNPFDFFLEKARVGLNEGGQFGPGGEGFVRLNYGCPRFTLMEGLERMRKALTGS